MSSQANALILDPESELSFTLSANEETPRCTMSLRHPGTTNEHLAFKVKTTQPRRYLVRPNQGLIAPGATERVAILLVEKDKQSLLQSYDRLGQSALDHAKDKFLVQSCSVSESFSSEFHDNKNKGSDNVHLYESLNQMWLKVTSGGASAPIQNKKLHVRLAVKETGNSSAPPTNSAAPATAAAPTTNESASAAAESMLMKGGGHQDNSHMVASIENMSPQQLFSEISSLRKKYDELVSFSVNLTAERDILNNTLEQTKRELNREMTTRATLENKGVSVASRGLDGSSPKKGGGGIMGTLLMLLVVGLAAFVGGVREAKMGHVDFMDRFFLPPPPPDPPVELAKLAAKLEEEETEADL